MNLMQTIFKITNRLKPVLMKILPHKMLRKIKHRLVLNSMQNMKQVKIEPFDKTKNKNGINLIGNIKAETGLGQSCRLVAKELLESQIDFSIYNYDQIGDHVDNNTTWDSKISSELPYNINLVHINPYEFGIAFSQLDKSVWDTRYNIAFWLWELEEFPDAWAPCISCFDEIWTPSEFISNSIRKKTKKPVKTIPYCVNALINKEYDRTFFHLPKDQLLFLMMYDSNSIIERKNPKAVFEAFKHAFPQNNTEVGLIVKVNNVTKEDLQIIKDNMSGYSNIHIITETLDKDQVNSLIKCSDVLVSLHRAEGFGLVLAEAMLLGTPTIATNWSSNTEFMNSEVSCLVNYKLIELLKDYGPFEKGNRWADADVVEAADYMKKLYEDKEFYLSISDRAKTFVENKLSMEKATSIINQRIGEIYEQS